MDFPRNLKKNLIPIILRNKVNLVICLFYLLKFGLFDRRAGDFFALREIFGLGNSPKRMV